MAKDNVIETAKGKWIVPRSFGNADAKAAAERAETSAQALNYLKDTMTDGTTDIAGGLVLTNVMALKDSKGNVTAGLSGLDEDNVLLWGGASYQDAVVAANHDYKKENGEKITTLLKKDGTGKIGVFKIDDDTTIIQDGVGYDRVVLTSGDYKNYQNSITNCSLSNSMIDSKAGVIKNKQNISLYNTGDEYLTGDYNFLTNSPEYVKYLSYINGKIYIYTIGRFNPTSTSTTNAKLNIYIVLPSSDKIEIYSKSLIKTNNYFVIPEFENGSSLDVVFNIDLSTYNIDKSTYNNFKLRFECDAAGEFDTACEFKYEINYVCTTSKIVLGPDSLNIQGDNDTLFRVDNQFGKFHVVAKGLPTYHTGVNNNNIYIMDHTSNRAAGKGETYKDKAFLGNLWIQTGNNIDVLNCLNELLLQYRDLLYFNANLLEVLKPFYEALAKNTSKSSGMVGIPTGETSESTISYYTNTLSKAIDQVVSCIKYTDSGTKDSSGNTIFTYKYTGADNVERNSILRGRTERIADAYKYPLSDLIYPESKNSSFTEAKYKKDFLNTLLTNTGNLKDTCASAKLLSIME